MHDFLIGVWQILRLLLQYVLDRLRGLSEFERKINLLALQLGEQSSLTLKSVSEKVALFTLNLKGGTRIPVLLTNVDPVVKVVFLTTVGFHEADFPESLAYGLLTRNGTLAGGSWQVLPVEGREVCCIACPMSLAGLGDSNEFMSVLKVLAVEFDAFVNAAKRDKLLSRFVSQF